MLPLLKFSGDEKDHSVSDAIFYLASEFKLTSDELNEWLPSKTQKIFTIGSIRQKHILKWLD